MAQVFFEEYLSKLRIVIMKLSLSCITALFDLQKHLDSYLLKSIDFYRLINASCI